MNGKLFSERTLTSLNVQLSSSVCCCCALNKNVQMNHSWTRWDLLAASMKYLYEVLQQIVDGDPAVRPLLFTAQYGRPLVAERVGLDFVAHLPQYLVRLLLAGHAVGRNRTFDKTHASCSCGGELSWTLIQRLHEQSALSDGSLFVSLFHCLKAAGLTQTQRRHHEIHYTCLSAGPAPAVGPSEDRISHLLNDILGFVAFPL